MHTRVHYYLGLVGAARGRGSVWLSPRLLAVSSKDLWKDFLVALLMGTLASWECREERLPAAGIAVEILRYDLIYSCCLDIIDFTIII